MGLENYTVDQVCEWVMSLGIDPNPFQENSVEGRDLLELDDTELKEYLGLKPLQVKKMRKRMEEMVDEKPQKSIFEKYQEEIKKTGGQDRTHVSNSFGGSRERSSDSGFGNGRSSDSGFGNGRSSDSGFGGGRSSDSGFGGGRSSDSGFGGGRSWDSGSKPRSTDTREGPDYSKMKACERGLAKGVYGNEDREAERDPDFERDMFQNSQNTGINFSSYMSIPAEATGNNVPPPIKSFNEPNFHRLLMENIQLAKYKDPTPVQSYGIPAILAGRDLMACAQTGSGKTAAFLFPILHVLISKGKTASDKVREEGIIGKCAFPEALIISPTRELSLQIFDECRKFAYRGVVKAKVVYGGADSRHQAQELSKGCHILIATPGRLCHFLNRRNVDISKVLFFVLDEADRMLDMGFEPQIRDIVENFGLPKQNRQTLMFSATFPREIQQLAGEFLNDYIFLTIGRVGSTNENIVQKILYVEENDKHDKLVEILSKLKEESKKLVLIFVQTKKQADTLEVYLKRLNFEADSIHGDRSQYEREDALESFKNGEKPYLVATDVAQRGLDIPNVACVINFDMPSSIDDYVHRIGRTGRAGNTGEAISFFNDSDTSLAADLVLLLKEVKQEVPYWLTETSTEHEHKSRYKPQKKDLRNSSRNQNNYGGGGGSEVVLFESNTTTWE